MNRISRFRQSAMHSGGVSLLKGFIYLIIALVSFYGDAVFVWMNIGHYDSWIFQIFLILGAVCTSASIMCLLWGKAYWFRPGKQLWIAYIFTGIEVLVNVLNIIVALNPNLGIVEMWRIFSPATPFVALIGWIVILQVDKEQRERHAQLEMEEQKNDSEREYQIMVHEANMDLKYGYLDQTKQRLQAALNSPQAQGVIEQHAMNLTAQVLNEITGLPVMQQQQQIAGPQPVTGQLSQLASNLLTPHLAPGQVCAADGNPAAAKVGSVWFCRECLVKIAEIHAKPMMTGNDLQHMFQQPQNSPLSSPQMVPGSHEGNQNGKQ